MINSIAKGPVKNVLIVRVLYLFKWYVLEIHFTSNKCYFFVANI